MATAANTSIFKHTSSSLFYTMPKFSFIGVQNHANVVPQCWERLAWCNHSSNKSEKCVNIMLHHLGRPMHPVAPIVATNYYNSTFIAYILAPPNTPIAHPKYHTCESYSLSNDQLHIWPMSSILTSLWVFCLTTKSCWFWVCFEVGKWNRCELVSESARKLLLG